ncbi:glucose-6-phosphate dehydrogenase [Mesoterricola silvestris]|uniref:Glucose-6-phosphate 1-dehydrogenase n=1 Tax=Mesoterricola silvestris TaxID=2927979 RepID=A0AA48GUN8_9BACT|nr:glucose-6-phosphate dehydrogenase [Mesoterricola silvestris]BDU72121.1 glucose-6-phosphate 1-dehydrogenase [Mesoterricola silvestris]
MEQLVQIVIFGASGDLAVRKLVPALLALARKDAANLQLVGIARRPFTDEAFRAGLRERLDPEEREAFAAFAHRVHYVQGDAGADLGPLSSRLDELAGGAPAGRLFYLSLKPDLFVPALENLGRSGLLQGEPWRRVIIEKPFGHDLASARALNGTLHQVAREEQIYRIDHYLGKETVQNLFAFRFNNAIFEPLWNRRHIELVQITVAEELGVEKGRAGYYDEVGALRDMVQNHMLQILALIAMEPPSSLDPETLRDQKVAALKALRFPATDPAVRARYAAGTAEGRPVPGYLQEEGVGPDSAAETFVALRAEVANWRWGGVPFLLRHGKRMPKRFTEVKVQFRVPPIQLFDGCGGTPSADGLECQLRPNHLTLSIQPREAMSLGFGVKVPGPGMVMAPAELAFDYRDRFGASTAPAYERLLLDAIHGDPSLFLRNDEVEAAWSAVDAIRSQPLLEYPAGSWGPPEADRLFHGCEGGWSRG